MNNYLKIDKKQLTVSLKTTERVEPHETAENRRAAGNHLKIYPFEQFKATKVPTSSEAEIQSACLLQSRPAAAFYRSFIEAGLCRQLRQHKTLCKGASVERPGNLCVGKNGSR